MKLEELLAAQNGVIAVKDHPSKARTLQRAAAAGELVRPLRGVFVAAGAAADPWTRLLAVTRWAEDGVLVGKTAWQLHQGLEPSPPFRVATRRRATPQPNWLNTIVRSVPPDQIVYFRGLRLASLPYVAVELAATDQGAAVFTALRERNLTSDLLIGALDCFRGSRGQRERQRIVDQAALNPWSFAEALLQGLLIAAGITGWVANRPIRLNGKTYYPDIRFVEKPLIIEFDGEAYHRGHAEFEGDLERQNQLMVGDYRVLRFTWEAITERPEHVVRTILAMLAIL
ncbi:MAG: DUF559 domain-containing protein [Propionicimonas sp.]